MTLLQKIPLALVAIAAVLPLLGAPQYWLYTLTIGLYYAMLASSWSLLVGYIGRISFAQAAMSGLGAYVSVLTGVFLGWPVVPALLRLKFQVQHPRPAGHRMLRWTDDTSTSTARNVA